MENLYLYVFIALCVAGYVVSLYLHPRVKCSACRGKGSHPGLVFRYADRPCRKCRGTGRQERLGHRLFVKPPK